MTRLAQVAIDAARERHPRIKLALKTLDAAEEMHAPEFSLARFEAQRLKRNCDLDVEPSLMHDALRLHQQIDAEVFATTFGEDAVALNAEGIEKDFEGFALVVERVEHYADVVVAEDVVALRDGGADLVRLVSGLESDVEKVRIETDKDFRWFGRRRVVARADLIEVFQHGSLFPDFFVELAVDRGWFVEFRDSDGL